MPAKIATLIVATVAVVGRERERVCVCVCAQESSGVASRKCSSDSGDSGGGGECANLRPSQKSRFQNRLFCSLECDQTTIIRA
jgi:hypothetical protein